MILWHGDSSRARWGYVQIWTPTTGPRETLLAFLSPVVPIVIEPQTRLKMVPDYEQGQGYRHQCGRRSSRCGVWTGAG